MYNTDVIRKHTKYTCLSTAIFESGVKLEEKVNKSYFITCCGRRAPLL